MKDLDGLPDKPQKHIEKNCGEIAVAIREQRAQTKQ